MIEKQVCSIDLAKRLDDLGVKKKSLFVWEYYNDGCYGIKFIPYALAKPLPEGCNQYSAFTVRDLGVLLPAKLQRHLSCVKLDNFWEIAYGLNEKIFADKNEADARAKMLIHLIENNLTTIEEINNGR